MYNCNSNRSYMALWHKIYNGLDTRALDIKIHCILSFVSYISINDLVLFGESPFTLKTIICTLIGIYNSYGSIIHEMITIRKTKMFKSYDKRHFKIYKNAPIKWAFSFFQTIKIKKNNLTFF